MRTGGPLARRQGRGPGQVAGGASTAGDRPGVMAAEPVQWAAVVRRSMGWVERHGLAVAVYDERGVEEAMLEAALDGDGLVLGDQLAVLVLAAGLRPARAARIGGVKATLKLPVAG